MTAWYQETRTLLRQLIRNGCVNTGRPETTVGEAANADLIADYLDGAGAELVIAEPEPGRRSVVARLEGSDPDCASLAMVGHLDVVPADARRWVNDPFGGELIGDEIWGRGAIDMLNVTAAMAVVLRRLAAGPRPRGTVVLAAVADEEAGGRLGAGHLVSHLPELVVCDGVVTESGGVRVGGSPGRVVVSVAEKGMAWVRLRVRGRSGHGSSPYGADNAVVKAATVVARLAEVGAAPQLHDLWAQYVAAWDLPPDVQRMLLNPADFEHGLTHWPEQARYAHACTHLTASVNVIGGGQKVNTIPDLCEIEVDIRTLPGGPSDVQTLLGQALGPLADQVEVEVMSAAEPTASGTDTALYRAIADTVAAEAEGATPLPVLAVGGTDAKFFRRAGSAAYGFGLMSPSISMPEFRRRFHGDDERIDLASLDLTTLALNDLCQRYSVAGTNR